MKKNYVVIATIIGIILALASCTDLKKDLPVASSGDTKIHDARWTDSSSANFHGEYIKNHEYKLDDCIPCHGNNFQGGVSGISCFKCHGSYPHNNGWKDDTSKAIFHGKYLKGKNWATVECKACHGTSYNGGISQKSCYNCHPAFPHEVKFVGNQGHQNYMVQNLFPFNECKKCHGANYTGGSITDISCSQSGCHRDGTSNPKSPEACNTCHGLFKAAANDTTSWAPPRALNGDTLETSPGVGAHQAHLAEGAISNLIKCNQCHKVPTSLTASGHYDSPLPAEVIFDTSLAALKSADRTYNPNPVFNSMTLKCSSPFCHGNWKIRKATSAYDFEFVDTLITGSAYSPKWTGGSTEALCGTTCHTLPPAGHNPEAITDCGGCHSNIVNSSGVIMDKTKHINGKIDVFGVELDF